MFDKTENKEQTMTQEQLQEQLDKATAKLEENIAEYAEILNKITGGEREKFSGNEFLSRKANFLAKITQTPEMREAQYYNDNFNDFCCAISPVKFLDFKSALNSAKSYKLVNDAEWDNRAGEQLADIMNEETEQYKNVYDVYDYDDVNAIVLRKALMNLQEDLPDIESLQQAFLHENYMCSEIQLDEEAFTEEIKEKIKKDGDEWINEIGSTSRALIKDFLCFDKNQTLEDFAKDVLKSTRKSKRS